MDEGTAHLDAKIEALVNDAIRRMGITRIIVAYRTETVSAAECNYFMGNGKLWKLDRVSPQADPISVTTA